LKTFSRLAKTPQTRNKLKGTPGIGFCWPDTHSEIWNNRDSGAKLQRIIFHDMAWPLAEKHLKEQFKI